MLHFTLHFYNMNKKIKTALEVLLFIIALIFLGFVGLFWWLTASPHSLPLLSPYIESSVQNFDANLRVSGADSVVHWSGFDMPLAVTVSNVKIIDPAEKIEITIPQIRLGIAPLPLIFGNLQFSQIAMENAVVILSATENTEGVVSETKTTEKKITIGEKALSGLTALPFKKITISSAEIIDRDSMRQLAIVDSATFGFLNNEGRRQLAAQINAKVNGKALNIIAKGYFGEISRVEGEFHGINPSELEQISSKHYGFDKIDLPLGGTFTIIFGDKLKLQSVDLSMQSERAGEVSYGNIIPGPVQVAALYATFKISDDFSRFTVKRLDFSGENGVKITSDNLRVYYPDMGKAEIAGRVDFENIDIPALLALWPDTKDLEDAKSWVRDSLSVGKAVKGFAEINIKPGDLIPNALPEDDVHAEITIENMEVNYSPRLKHLQAVNGLLRFGGNTMNIEVKSGRLENSDIHHATAVIPDLAVDNGTIHIEGESDGKAEDLNEFIALQAADDKEKSHVIKITAGHADTTFTLDVPLLKDLKAEQVKVSAKSKMGDIAIPAVYDGTDLTAGNLEVFYSPEELTADGDVMLNSVKATAKYSEKYKGDKTSTTLELVGRFPASEIARITGDDLQFLTGDVPLGLNLVSGDSQNIQVKADLTDNTISLPRYGYEKAKGKGLKLEFVLDGDKKAAKGKINLTGDLLGEGDLVFGKDYQLTAANVKDLAFGKTDMSLEYALVSGNKYRVEVAGKVLDLAPIIADYGNEPEEKSESSYDISVSLKKILLDDGESLSGLNGSISCLPEYCATGRFTAHQDSGGEFLYELKRAGGQDGKMTIHADNAGAVIKGLGVSPHIVGGKLDINSDISRNHNNSINEGTLVMTNYSVVKGPVLAKIVNLASFTGILDVLNGAGIKFKKMTLNFSKENDVMKIKESKAYGDSLGITAQGFADLKKSEINITGTVVPAYAVNSLLSTVPVIGDVLAGGEGQGIIAANYKVSGSYRNPDVSTNPLSLLTPGFLRGLFDIFDDKKEAPKVEDKNVAPAAENAAPEAPSPTSGGTSGEGAKPASQ